MDVRMNHRVTETDTDALYQRFPHLRRIDLIWGTPECRKYIFGLMTDTRGGTRMGFPKEHAQTVMKLLMEHDRCFPQFEHQIVNLWGEDEKRRGSRK
jgi:hypothetical protein